MNNLTLFNDSELSEYLETQVERIEKLVLGIGAQRLINTDINKIVSEITKKLSVAHINLSEDSITVTNKETRVDASNDPFRFVSNRNKPVLVSGTKVTYYVPFQGKVELLKLRPNRYSYNQPQVAKIIKNELIFEYVTTEGNVKRTKTEFDKALRDVKQWIGYTNDQIERHNQDLIAPVRSQLLNRQKILISSQEQINELGFKLRPKQTRTSRLKPQTKEVAKSVGNSKVRTEIKKVVQPKTVKAKKSLAKKNVEELEYDVALSFAGEDRAYVDKVARRLRSKGIKVFYDKFIKAKLWGNNLIDHLGEVYSKKSRFIVMFISHYYAEKEWTNHERKFAQEREFKLKKTCILPARFDNTPILGLNSTLGYVDLKTTTPNELADLIIERITD